jgi:hypothetical protein
VNTVKNKQGFESLRNGIKRRLFVALHPPKSLMWEANRQAPDAPCTKKRRNVSLHLHKLDKVTQQYQCNVHSTLCTHSSRITMSHGAPITFTRPLLIDCFNCFFIYIIDRFWYTRVHTLLQICCKEQRADGHQLLKEWRNGHSVKLYTGDRLGNVSSSFLPAKPALRPRRKGIPDIDYN